MMLSCYVDFPLEGVKRKYLPAPARPVMEAFFVKPKEARAGMMKGRRRRVMIEDCAVFYPVRGQEGELRYLLFLQEPLIRLL